jgi:hypothetical protein
LFSSPVFSPPKDVGIWCSPNTLKYPSPKILYHDGEFLGLVYFSGIFTPEKCGDMWGFGVHPILSNLLKYSSPKILYHDGEFLN